MPARRASDCDDLWREPLNQQIPQGRRERRSRRISGGDHEDHAASGPLPQERLLFVDAMLNGSRSLVVIPDMIYG